LSESYVRYPLSKEPLPGDGSSVPIAPGIHWLRMPLHLPLRWINVWVLEDGDAWTIVDTGSWSAETELSWQRAFASLMGGKPVRRVIATHMHHDHCGMAGWLTERFPARLWMSRLEYLTCRVMASDRDSVPQDVIDFYRAAGWDENALTHYRSRFGYIGRQIYPMPSGYRRLTDGECIQIGDNCWTVLMGNGHSPEHACLYCPARKLFIAGDQILPRITSNVSVYPIEPDANPLSDWMNSLRNLGQKLSGDTLILPAHNSPFLGIHERLEQLLAHHEESLSRLLDFLRNTCRVTDVFKILFKKPITADTIHMATGEALAHLNYLKGLGKVAVVQGDDGILLWRAI
jgi:glyoxylase-like metal-dependent hydrolase (beta-lactamase superfamily II)